MAYFKYLPKVFVRNKTRVNGSQPYELSVNIFRRIKIRDDLQGSLLGFTQYEIQAVSYTHLTLPTNSRV